MVSRQFVAHKVLAVGDVDNEVLG
uniref:Uncharacterized protein n=1 Tax=Arundo donax TaxID=35708 RepID=A0A0A9EMC4_ARUDO